MATRCMIKIEGIDFAKVYKHWDGYPEAMMDWLQKFNKEFTESRGEDPQYKFAQLLRSSIVDYETYNEERRVNQLTLGWGVVGFDDEMWEEYTYTLHTDGSVTYVEHYGELDE